MSFKNEYIDYFKELGYDLFDIERSLLFGCTGGHSGSVYRVYPLKDAVRLKIIRRKRIPPRTLELQLLLIEEDRSFDFFYNYEIKLASYVNGRHQKNLGVIRRIRKFDDLISLRNGNQRKKVGYEMLFDYIQCENDFWKKMDKNITKVLFKLKRFKFPLN